MTLYAWIDDEDEKVLVLFHVDRIWNVRRHWCFGGRRRRKKSETHSCVTKRRPPINTSGFNIVGNESREKEWKASPVGLIAPDTLFDLAKSKQQPRHLLTVRQSNHCLSLGLSLTSKGSPTPLIPTLPHSTVGGWTGALIWDVSPFL